MILGAWQSSDGADRQALSVVTRQANPDALERVLSQTKAALGPEHAFVVLDVLDRGDDWLWRTCVAVQRFDVGRRIVVSVRPADLVSDRSLGTPWPSGLGLMLDVADQDVPFSAFLHDHVEAVRFAPELVDRAGGYLRHGLVLASMLQLTRELGLASLGPAAEEAQERLAGGARFDYAAQPESFPSAGLDVRPEQFGFAFSR